MKNGTFERPDRTLKVVALFGALTFLAACAPDKNFRLGDNSMSPTFRAGETLEFSSYAKEGLEQIPLWKVVLVKNQRGKGQMVLRVAAVPGERVRLDQHGIRVQGEMRHPPLATEGYNFSRKGTALPYGEYFIVPEGQYLLLADSPQTMWDSRTFGTIPENDIIGLLKD